MPTAHMFEDFGTVQPAKVGKRSMSVEELEDLKLESFETGYQAGWEDAVKAQSNSDTHVSAELATSLQSASFEYHELRATLNASVQSIMAEIVETILPIVAQASLGAHIRDYVVSRACEALDRPIEIAVSPVSEAAVRAMLAEDVPEPFKLIIDPTLSSSQAILRVGTPEAEINLGRTVADIASAVETFFETPKSKVTDGRPT